MLFTSLLFVVCILHVSYYAHASRAQINQKSIQRAVFKQTPKFIASFCVAFSTFQNGFFSPSHDNSHISVASSSSRHNPNYHSNIVYAAEENSKIFNEVWNLVHENFFDDTYNNRNWDDVKKEYLQKKSLADDHDITANALSLLGDKYTRLLDKERYQSLWKYDAIGIGLLLQSDKTSMIVPSDPLPKSSSYNAGIKKNDLILSINGVSTEGKTALDILDMMSNDERDDVVIEFKHPSNSNSVSSPNAATTAATADDAEKVQKVTLKRVKDEVKNPVTFSIQKLSNPTATSTDASKTISTVGYIKLSEFNSEAVHGLEKAIKSINSEKQPVDAIVLDLRGNLGGGFQFALNIGGMFMNDQLMVTAVGRNNEKTVFRTSYPDGVLYNVNSEKPLILLIDNLSASASEVLASGLHDNCKAVLVGSKSYGKGKIQAVFGLSNGEGMTMTVAQYVSPKGYIIQDKGIQPDISLSDPINPYLSVLLPSSVTETVGKPDLNKIDYNKVKELTRICEAK